RLSHLLPTTPPRPPTSTLFPYTTLFRSGPQLVCLGPRNRDAFCDRQHPRVARVEARAPLGNFRLLHRLRRWLPGGGWAPSAQPIDRKSTRLNSSHLGISYAVFCLKKKKN